MSIDFHAIIPARYHASRLPGKLLMDIGGMSVLERVYRQVLKAHPKRLIIATDHPELFAHAASFGAEVVMTDKSHQSGTDRIAEVVARSDFKPDDIIVNVQGDEAFIEPRLITQVADCLQQTEAPVATLCSKITSIEERDNPNVVKVVRDCNHHALYFSRSSIPAHRGDSTIVGSNVFRHIGLYAYRAAFLLEIVAQPVCELEAMESLEQLRVLWLGYKIQVEEALVSPVLNEINTAEDLDRARQQWTMV